MGADGEVAAALDPGDGRDEIVVGQFAELGDFARGGIPHVDAGAEADAEDVGRAPVDEIEVEVVREFGGVEDFVRNFGDGSGLFAGCLEDGLGGAAHWGEGVEVGSGVEVYDARVFGCSGGWGGATGAYSGIGRLVREHVLVWS